MIPADMTPDELRGMAQAFSRHGYRFYADLADRWADELEAAQPAPLTAEDEFPVGCRVQFGALVGMVTAHAGDCVMVRTDSTGTLFTPRRSEVTRIDTPDPDAPFPVGARVESIGGFVGTVLAAHEEMRWVLTDRYGVCSYHIDSLSLSPAPVPMVPVPADLWDKAVAGTLTDDDRAALARAGEGE